MDDQMMTKRGAAWLLLSIIAAGACLRLVAFGGLVGTDDAMYADLAHRVISGQFLSTHSMGLGTFPLRVGVFAPAALAFRLFGIGEAALVVYPFLISLLSIYLAFLAGRMFFGERAGIIAAILHACLPFDVRYSTLLFPDLIAAFWTNASILLLYRASREAAVRLQAAQGLLCGLALGVAWLCKESILFSLPFVGFYLLWSTYKQRRSAGLAVAVAAGFSAVLIGESFIYYFCLSDPLYHLHALERHNQMPAATVWFWNPAAPWAGGLLGRLLRDGPQAMLLNTEFGLTTAVAVLSIAYGIFRGCRSIWFVAAWFLYHVFIFNFGSHSLRSYMPLPAWEHRYFYPLLLPAVLLVAVLLDSLLRRRDPAQLVTSERLFWGFALAFILVVGHAHGLYRDLKTRDVSYVERGLARMLSPGTPLYTDSRTAWLLRFFWSYPTKPATVDFAGMQAGEIPPGAYVFVNPRRVEVVLHYGYRPPAFLDAPPAGWVPRWESGPARLYQVPN
jgi:4-amino-4-deoxy-L-arabinose transferase-like glycosyltransferase